MPRRRSWAIGGGLLVASGVLLAAGSAGVGGAGGLRIAAVAAASAAYLVFALGIPDGGRVAGAGRTGTASLAILAVWSLVSAILWATPADLTPVLDWVTVASWVDLLGQLALAAVAAAGIARAGIVPSPWNRAPLWALAATVLPAIATQVLVAADPAGAQEWAPVLAGLGALVATGVPISLGVIALVLAQRPVPERSVEVFSSADADLS
ncbi:hypothetical protein GCM10022200_11900 [Microbacterium awajiense]|uniref:Uncharacterized protein n=2 Tax=Microbacterium awajiense TaxID=415214 RepID=A0ABP7AET2_9MICO